MVAAGSRYAVIVSFLFIGTCFAPDNACGQHADRTRFLRWMVTDAAALVEDPDAGTVLYAAGGAAVLSAAFLLDETIDRSVGGTYRDAAYLRLTNELGGPKATWPVVGLFVVSLATDNERFQDAAFTSLQSLLYTGALSYGLKYAVGRVRPEDIGEPDAFRPFSGHSSFPSGHTSTAFAILTPWALYYRHPATYALLAIGAGGTAASRIVRDKHWVSDVIAGGAIGFLTAYRLTRRHQEESASAYRITLRPSVGTETVSLAVSIRF